MINLANIDFFFCDTWDKFPLAWRFTDARYNKLPEEHLSQIKPLTKEAAEFIWNYINEINLHQNVPFKKDFFKTVIRYNISKQGKENVKKWLYQTGLPFQKIVILSWQPDSAALVPWKLFIKYWDDFYYSDDLTIIDKTLNWAILFYHEDEIYFGTNTKYETTEAFEGFW